jgi:hypothetical protein
MLNRFKNRWFLDLLAMVLFVIPQSGAVSAANPTAAEAAQMLSGRELGSTPMLEDLEELCDRIGGRPTGSEACNRAVDWAVAKFRAAGVDAVHTESYTIPNLWLSGKSEGECLEPARFPIRLAAAPGTASTPAVAIEAPLVDVGEGSAEGFAVPGEKARGAIALVHSRQMETAEDLFREYARDRPLLAQLPRSAERSVLFAQG